MDVDDAAAGEDFLKTVFFQLVVAGTATDDYGFNVEVVEGVCLRWKATRLLVLISSAFALLPPASCG